MPRQTDLSLEELVSRLTTASACGAAAAGELSDGCIVNEIGEIFWSSDPDSIRAEEELVTLARQGTEGIHWVAYKYLSDDRAPRKTPAALEAIELYETNARSPSEPVLHPDT